MGCGCAQRREALKNATNRTVRRIVDGTKSVKKTLSPRTLLLRKTLRR